VARYPISRLHVSGHRFLVRRLEHAVLGDASSGADSVRLQRVSLAFGALLAVLIVAGCAVLGWFRPARGLGDAPIVMDRVTGALYVRVDDIVHPVLNLTSARLIAQAPDDPRRVMGVDLATAEHGPLLGIPGAPAQIGAVLPGADAAWTACDGAGTAIVAGPLDRSGAVSPLTEGESVLVSSRSGTAYLLHDGRRAVVDLADPATVRALQLDGLAPRPVSQALLGVIPEAPAIVAPVIPDLGSPGPQALPGFLIGDVVRVPRATQTGSGSDYFVVLAGGVQRIGLVAAELIRFTTARPGTEITEVAPSAIRQIPTVGVLPVSEFPDRIGTRVVGDVVCASWAAGAVSVSTGARLPLDGDRKPVTLAQADGDGPAVDAVFVPPGRSGYVRPAGSAAAVGSVITDTGVRFAIGDPAAAKALGLPDRPEPAPWPLLMLLPSGPELRRDAALVARDVVTSGPP
jgi:type VII secretion protein EccB